MLELGALYHQGGSGPSEEFELICCSLDLGAFIVRGQ
jgi:hypothetical protein